MIKLELPDDSVLVLTHAGEMLINLASALAGGGVTEVTNAEPATGEIPPLPPGSAEELPPDVKLDAARLPWDERIYGSSKSFLKSGERKGCWKYKKGVDKTLIASVEAELRAKYAVPTDEQHEPPPPVPPAGVNEVPPPPSAVDFGGLVQKITGLVSAGKLTTDTVNAVLAPHGVNGLPGLGTRLDLVPTINAEIDKLCPPTP